MTGLTLGVMVVTSHMFLKNVDCFILIKIIICKCNIR